DAALGDIESGPVRRHDHSRRPHATQARDQRRGKDALPGKDLSIRHIDALDQVIVPVGDEKTAATRRQIIGSTAADGGAVIRWSADEQTGLPVAEYFWCLRA